MSLDYRIYDAINLFKYSHVGRGTARIDGDAEYRTRYQRLAREVLRELWRLWAAEEIGFADMVGAAGHSGRRSGPDILVNDRLEPSTDPAAYATSAEQGKLAATSCNLVHEATHLVRNRPFFEEEVLCETIQLHYFRELRVGRSFESRVTGTRQTAAYGPGVPFYSEYNDTRDRLHARRRLIDHVFRFQKHRDNYLERPRTAAFVARSLGWWGGLTNRWRTTRGYFLRSLAAQKEDYAEPILQVLESLRGSDWPRARACAGDLQKVRRGLRLTQYGEAATRIGGHLSYDSAFADRVRWVQSELGESFGV